MNATLPGAFPLFGSVTGHPSAHNSSGFHRLRTPQPLPPHAFTGGAFFFHHHFFFFSFFKNILLPRLQKVCARLRKSVRERKKKVAKKKSKIINDNQSAGELRFFSSVAVVNGRWGRRLMMTGRWRWWNNLSDLLKPSAISSSNSGLFDRLLQLLCFPVESNKPISWATVVQTPSVEPSE